MFRNGQKLRKVSDGIFQEAEPPPERGRPFEWRRRYNLVTLPLKELRLTTSHSVHDKEFNFRQHELEDPDEIISQKLGTIIQLRGALDADKCRDRFYFAHKDKSGETYTLEYIRGSTCVTLNGRQDAVGKSQSEADLGKAHEQPLPSHAFSSRDLHLADDFLIDLNIPIEQMISISSAIKENELTAISVDAHLLSYTFEVDDALSEPWHPRDIVMLDPTHCYVARVNVSRELHSVVRSNDDETDERPEDIEDSQGNGGPNSNQEDYRSQLVASLISFNKSLNRLVTALWTLLVFIVLGTFFG